MVQLVERLNCVVAHVKCGQPFAACKSFERKYLIVADPQLFQRQRHVLKLFNLLDLVSPQTQDSQFCHPSKTSHSINGIGA
jgi:hypothetical protein